MISLLIINLIFLQQIKTNFMKRIVYLLLIVSLSSCSQKESQSVMYALDNPAERVVWERLRIADPNTGKIPKNIRKKEMMYASTLPVSKPIGFIEDRIMLEVEQEH